MAIKETFEQLTAKVNENPSHIKDFQATYQFNITGETGGVYQLDFSNEKAIFSNDKQFDPKITLELTENDFLKLVNGDLNPTVAYMTGKLKVKGDLSLALKLNTLLKQYQ
ncbi:SCP2 sterol-binding domain-containing protein [Evansella sp. AB-P1]|uniref:SCP2 sterol-binding domain-containing protein n=1 Tax=Evansella sp. AB-P1 TaxID=3037653 RepID=UPI00241F4C79|nr:SCP2 sterol-binding domain-containing protein [Evansella sp. AB-P1]MDG5786113.1 SCP2 sterol-binding domain-containing protein [Evansella sp. AB-P1]